MLDELERSHQVDAELKDETFLSRNVRVKPSPTKERTRSENASVRSHSQSRDHISDATGDSGVEEGKLKIYFFSTLICSSDEFDPGLENTHMEELRKKYKAEEAVPFFLRVVGRSYSVIIGGTKKKKNSNDEKEG